MINVKSVQVLPLVSDDCAETKVGVPDTKASGLRDVDMENAERDVSPDKKLSQYNVDTKLSETNQVSHMHAFDKTRRDTSYKDKNETFEYYKLDRVKKVLIIFILHFHPHFIVFKYCMKLRLNPIYIFII